MKYRIATLLFRVPVLFLLVTHLSMPAASAESGSDVSEFSKKENTLLVHGRVVYDKERIEGVKGLIYRGNDLVMEFVTEKSGRYEVELEYGHQYMLHFSKEGYLNKMFAVDTQNNIPKGTIENPAFPVNVIMIPMDKFAGVDMDMLEFPFAHIGYNKRDRMFQYDPKYTQNMSRALAAAMLQSSRKKD
jgi:hypothetical protein